MKSFESIAVRGPGVPVLSLVLCCLVVGCASGPDAPPVDNPLSAMTAESFVHLLATSDAPIAGIDAIEIPRRQLRQWPLAELYLGDEDILTASATDRRDIRLELNREGSQRLDVFMREHDGRRFVCFLGDELIKPSWISGPDDSGILTLGGALDDERSRDLQLRRLEEAGVRLDQEFSIPLTSD